MRLMRIVAPSLFLAFLAAPGTATTSGPALAPVASWDDLQESSGGLVGNVILSCHEYHPDLIPLQNGDSVTFEYQDLCAPARHTVTSSGSTLDPDQDRNKPQPQVLGLCFDSSPEGVEFAHNGETYSLTLIFAGTLLRVVDPLAADVRPCPAHNSVDTDPLAGVVPFFCRFHGIIDDPGFGMRGALEFTL